MSGAWVPGMPDCAEARVTLFCFAHAGGGAALFRPWRAAFDSEIAIRPVVLPGRETRLRERPYLHMNQLIAPMVAALLPHARGPYALFGHSLGSLLAYEAARHLPQAGAQPPIHLFVSGRRAPHLPALKPNIARLPDAAFLAAVARLNGTPPAVMRDHHLMQVFLPALRADFEVNETYEPTPRPALACPVSAFAGDRDDEVLGTELAAWREVTTGPFEYRLFPGDHFYFKESHDEMVTEIRSHLVK